MLSSARSHLLAVAALGSTSLALLAAPANAQVPPAAPGTVPGAWIVTLQPGQAPERVADEHARQHGAQVDHLYRHALRGYAARMPEQTAARVARDPRVASVQRDRVVTAAAPPNREPASSAAQSLPTGIQRINGELSRTVSGDGGGNVDVDLAVIDTGIDVDHPDLNVVGGKNCVRGGKSTFDDGNGHGTHVAGTIGAEDDGEGVVGVAPGARLWAVRVLDDRGSGTWSSIICGVDWVTANRGTVEVANMSLGGSGTEPTAAGCSTGDALHDAICTSVSGGVTYVVAAGNDSADAAGFVPAAYDEVLTVSALADFDGDPGGGAAATCRSDLDDTFADFSNHGPDVDLIAPGVCIHSTWKGGGYNTISGTSMASPHVAGAAALYRAAHDVPPEEVRAALLLAANAGWDNSDDGDPAKEPLLDVGSF